jgi:hypothetical protein
VLPFKRKKLRRKKKRQLNRITTGYFSFFFHWPIEKKHEKGEENQKKEMANFEKLLIVFQWNKNRKERERENKMCVVKQKESNYTTRGKDHQTGLRLQPRHSFSKHQQQ